jgi:ketosteroid isomerase-like protein
VNCWLAAVKAKDAVELASMVTEDCIFLPPNAPPIRGRLAVQKLYTGLFARYTLTQTFPFKEVNWIADWAFAWGRDDIAIMPVSGGAAVPCVGHDMKHFAAGVRPPMAFCSRHQQCDPTGS